MRAKSCVDDTNSSSATTGAGGRGMTLAPAIAEESFQ
jgi:hypothetical protein